MTARTVRHAEPDDVETLVVLCAEHARFERVRYEAEGKAAWLSDALFGATPRLKAWIAVVHEQEVGYATVTEEISTWNAAAYLHMDCLFVRPGHRNGGLGSALLGAVSRYARERGLHELQWQTPAWNADACRFYRRHGGIEQTKLRFCLPIG